MATRFAGFPIDAAHFLKELARNNRRPWFEANRGRYEASVRQPALAFIEAMRGPLAKAAPHLVAEPKKVGGSLMRIHRDTRFGSDKSPYKTNIGIQFRHAAGRDVHAPGVYLHVEAESVFLGVGLWRPERDALAAIRAAIDSHPEQWRRARGGKAFRERFRLAGDALKRAPAGYPTDHPWIDDLRRTDHIAVWELELDHVLGPGLVATVVEGCRSARAYMGFLCSAIGLPY